MTEFDYTRAQEAVSFVMRALPDRYADRDKIMEQAINLVSTDADKRKIATLVLISPTHYGVQRKHVYWNIVFSVLPKEDALPLYLEQFPQEITQAQYSAVYDYVKQIFKLAADDVEDVLDDFIIRPKVNSFLTKGAAQGSCTFAHAY